MIEAAAEKQLRGGAEAIGIEPGGLETIAQGGAGESGVGVVAAGADDRFAALGGGATGDGALHASDAGGQPDEATSGTAAETNQAKPACRWKQKEKNEKCHFSRTDPFYL